MSTKLGHLVKVPSFPVSQQARSIPIENECWRTPNNEDYNDNSHHTSWVLQGWVSVSPKLHTEMEPQLDGTWRHGLWKAIRSWMGLGPSKKGPHSPSPPIRTHGKTGRGSRKRPSLGPGSAGSTRTLRNTCCCWQAQLLATAPVIYNSYHGQDSMHSTLAAPYDMSPLTLSAPHGQQVFSPPVLQTRELRLRRCMAGRGDRVKSSEVRAPAVPWCRPLSQRSL